MKSKQADTLGWALMATGISEITEKRIFQKSYSE